MKEFSKNKVMHRIIYFTLILLIILSNIYLVKYFKGKRDIEKERNLLNSIDMEEIEKVNKEAKISKQNENSNNKNSESMDSAALKKTEEEIKEEEQMDLIKRMTQVSKLKEEYKNIVGWIEIEDTNISYPVVQGKDNDFYLTHDYKGDNAERGAIFLDSNYNWNIDGNNFMIYGHYMINGEMFTDLLKYLDKDFYEKHPIIRFTTDNEDEEYSIIAVFRSKVYNKNEEGVFKYYNFINSDNEKEYNNFIKNVKEASIYNIKETARYGDQLITLTTCSYYTEDGRFVIVGRKKER